MFYNYNTCTVTVDPLGTPEVLRAIVRHVSLVIGSRPNELVVNVVNKRPQDLAFASYRGKLCTLVIDGTTVLTGHIVRQEKQYVAGRENQLGRLEAVFTIQDLRSNMGINATYVGAGFLETLGSDGIPTAFTNGLAGYGADITFNLHGKPNRKFGSLDFSYLGYEHNDQNAAYWNYGCMAEWIWANCITAVAAPLPASAFTVINQAAGDGGSSGTIAVGFSGPWAALPSSAWITVSPTSGTGAGTVSWTTADNSNQPARTGDVVVTPWGFGGMENKGDETPTHFDPVGKVLGSVFDKTCCQWYLDGSGNAVIFDISNPVATLPLDIKDLDSPTASTVDTPIELFVETSVDDAVCQLDILGANQQRECLLHTDYTGDWYHNNLVQTYTDFDRVPWFGISPQGGWIGGVLPGFNPFNATWSNYNVERYIRVYVESLGPLPYEQIWRYNLKNTIYETHKIGKNLSSGEQPYSMQSQLMIARDKNGNYVNPLSPGALEGVGPLEMLAGQYADGSPKVDLDRGYILARGVGPWIVSNEYVIEPPYFSLAEPNKFTVTFECGYRAWQSASGTISGLPVQPRRAVVRDELIHMTREATKVSMPIVASIDDLDHWTITDGIPLPAGATRDYITSGSGPLPVSQFTITLPSGIVVDAMSALNEIKAIVQPYVALVNVNGRGAFASWRNLALGTRLTDAIGFYDLTNLEVVTAVSWSDEDQQRLQFAFTNRLGNDVRDLAEAFVDTRQYRRPL